MYSLLLILFFPIVLASPASKKDWDTHETHPDVWQSTWDKRLPKLSGIEHPTFGLGKKGLFGNPETASYRIKKFIPGYFDNDAYNKKSEQKKFIPDYFDGDASKKSEQKKERKLPSLSWLKPGKKAFPKSKRD